MRSLFQCFAVTLLALLVAAAPARAAGSRQSAEFTAGWTFARTDTRQASDPSFDDAAWDKVTLPHTFNAGDGERPDYYRGPVWYRRAFEVRARRPDRRLFVQFDGAATAADVYLNGRHIGRHEGGHAAFRFDLTHGVRIGRNVLAVRVDNGFAKSVAPLGGDFTIFGGLYRPVSLIEVDATHFDLLDHGAAGIYALARDIRPGNATVEVQARVRNMTGSRRVPLTVRILDSQSREVARANQMVQLPAHGVRPVHVQMMLPNPRRWDGVRDPYLYHIVAQLGANGDQVTVPLGIREFRFDPERGFILNGRAYPLRGANLMHSARPGKGTAVTLEEIREDFAILKGMGSTGVRLVHFQHPQAAYDEADRLGLAAWTEIGINSLVEDTPEFRANARQQLKELILQNFNHPSVVLWGLGNEVYSTEPHVARILAELDGVAKQIDPSRPTVYAHCCQGEDDPKAKVTDVIGFNKYFGWYPDQKGMIGEWADHVHAAHPHRSIGVSEYGAGASIVHQQDPPGEVVPASGWHPEQYQSLYHEKNWLELRGRQYLWGTFVWVAFDLASAGRREGDRPGINDKGLVTYDRKVRKDAWYWYQANWSDVPMLHIASRRFTHRVSPDVEVKAYTNAGPATLLVNGLAIGTQSPVNHILRWQVRLREGANRIEVRSRSGPVDAVNWTYAKAPDSLAN